MWENRKKRGVIETDPQAEANPALVSKVDSRAPACLLGDVKDVFVCVCACMNVFLVHSSAATGNIS